MEYPMPRARDDRRHIIPVSGKDSLATALVQRDRMPGLPYEYVFLDVGMELPETYRWLDRVEGSLGVTLTRMGKSLTDVITYKGMLPSHQRRFCTELGKIIPMRTLVDEEDAVQYIGLRADEDDRVGMMMKHSQGLKTVFPLREEGIDLAGVYQLLDTHGLLPPNFFWQRLYDAVLSRCTPTSRRFLDALPPWRLSHLFSWRSRSNCYMCFYQRLYEWAGLLEHHPDLFAEAEALERDHGGTDETTAGSTRLKMFTLRPDGPLGHVRARAGEIFRARVDKVYKAVVEMRHDPDADPMAQTSCGVYCGK